ncbi:MAG: hypothetical protein R3C68_14615 [Myxococcota bacterium]
MDLINTGSYGRPNLYGDLILTGAADCNCRPSAEVCNDGVDNDCDAHVDGADADCQDEVCTPTREICDDGIDNDCDGNTDMTDAACQESGACPESYVVVNSDSADADQHTIVVNDAEGNTITCARFETKSDALGCSESGAATLAWVWSIIVLSLRRKRRV